MVVSNSFGMCSKDCLDFQDNLGICFKLPVNTVHVSMMVTTIWKASFNRMIISTSNFFNLTQKIIGNLGQNIHFLVYIVTHCQETHYFCVLTSRVFFFDFERSRHLSSTAWYTSTHLNCTAQFVYGSHQVQGKSIFHQREVNTRQTMVSACVQQTLTSPYWKKCKKHKQVCGLWTWKTCLRSTHNSLNVHAKN